MPTPMIAVSSGSPAATSEPKVMTRTTAAMARPMTSPIAPGSAAAWQRVAADLDGQPGVLRLVGGRPRGRSLVASVSSMPGTS